MYFRFMRTKINPCLVLFVVQKAPYKYIFDYAGFCRNKRKDRNKISETRESPGEISRIFIFRSVIAFSYDFDRFSEYFILPHPKYNFIAGKIWFPGIIFLVKNLAVKFHFREIQNFGLNPKLKSEINT